MSAREGKALLDAVYEAPHDDSARLVYADWLQERGDPRGELIVLQYRSDRTPEQREREAELLEVHGEAWQGPLGKLTTWAEFERGFLARCGLREIPRSALDHREWATVEHVGIADRWNRDLSPLLSHAGMKSLRSVRMPADALERLLGQSARSPVERLALDGNLTTDRLQRLVESSMFERVTSLDVKGALVGDAMFAPAITTRFEELAFASGGWRFTMRRGSDGRLSTLGGSLEQGRRWAPRTDTLAGAIAFFEAIPDDALTNVELSLPKPPHPRGGLDRLRATITRQRRLTHLATR